MPKAWVSLISEPDEFLVELLKDRVENLCGFSPTPSELISFVKDIQKDRVIEIPTPPRRDSTVPDSSKIQVGQKRKSHSKGRKRRLVISFPNGQVIDRPFAAESFAVALEEFGVEKVRVLNLLMSGFPLLSTTKSEKYPQNYTAGPYYVMTWSATSEKKEMLEEIARSLGERIDVKIV